MMDTSTADRIGRTEQGSAKAIGRGTLIGTVAAVAVNLVILAIGNVGAPVEVVTGWAPDGAPLTVGEVVGTTVVAVAAGGLVLWLVDRWRRNALSAWTVVAAGVAVLSAIPLWRLEVDTGSKVTLTVMHLVTGLIAIAAQHEARSRRSAVDAGSTPGVRVRR